MMVHSMLTSEVICCVICPRFLPARASSLAALSRADRPRHDIGWRARASPRLASTPPCQTAAGGVAGGVWGRTGRAVPARRSAVDAPPQPPAGLLLFRLSSSEVVRGGSGQAEWRGAGLEPAEPHSIRRAAATCAGSLASLPSHWPPGGCIHFFPARLGARVSGWQQGTPRPARPPLETGAAAARRGHPLSPPGRTTQMSCCEGGGEVTRRLAVDGGAHRRCLRGGGRIDGRRRRALLSCTRGANAPPPVRCATAGASPARTPPWPLSFGADAPLRRSPAASVPYRQLSSLFGHPPPPTPGRVPSKPARRRSCWAVTGPSTASPVDAAHPSLPLPPVHSRRPRPCSPPPRP